ncbi:conserved membrane protein of unknown function [Cyanobium sp. NIES-981]|nr:conserved membrane protein of unknown function [Cyanobium sp. NIES-981]
MAVPAAAMADRLDLQLISAALRRLGWVRFWIQLVLAVVVVGVLVFNNIGGRLAANSSRALGLGPGISLTTLSFLLLLWCLWQSWLVVRCGRALASPVRPSRGETARLVKRGLLADLAGLSLAAVGYQAMAGSLFVQASQQVPGFFGAQIQSQPGTGGRVIGLPITSIEMFSVLGNTQVLFAHLIGLAISLWLLQRIYRTT